MIFFKLSPTSLPAKQSKDKKKKKIKEKVKRAHPSHHIKNHLKAKLYLFSCPYFVSIIIGYNLKPKSIPTCGDILAIT